MVRARIIKYNRTITNLPIYFLLTAISLQIALLLLSPLSTALVYYPTQQAIAQSTSDTTTSMISAPNQRSNTLTYGDSTCNIRIQYPSDWLRDAGSASSDYIVAFVPLAGINATAGGFENVKIKVINPQGMSLDQYTSIASKAFGVLPNSKIVESGKTTVGRNNNPGFGVTYSVTDPRTSNEVRTMEVWTLANNIIYDVTYDASPANYAVYLPLVKAMVSTLEIGAPSQQCLSQMPSVQSLAPPDVVSGTGSNTTTASTTNPTK